MRSMILRLSGVVLVALFGLCLVPTYSAKAADIPRGWHNTGIVFVGLVKDNVAVADIKQFCFDNAEPNIAYYSVQSEENPEEIAATYVINWRTGQREIIDKLQLDNCGNGGTLFGHNPKTNETARYSRSDPQGKTLVHYPTAIAQDGTNIVYSTSPCNSTDINGRYCLFVSSDTGTTWHDRTPANTDDRQQIVVSPDDARHIYYLTSHHDDTGYRWLYTLYVSTDAGVTWEKRATGGTEGSMYGYVGLGLLTPAHILELDGAVGLGSHNTPTNLYLSNDDGRTFVAAGMTSPLSYTRYAGTVDGKLIRQTGATDYTTGTSNITYAISSDGGKTWRDYAWPAEIYGTFPRVVPVAPANWLADFNGALWYSPNSGQSWQDVAANPETLYVSPYLPLTVLGVFDNRLYSLDLPNAGKSQTQGVPVKDSPGNTYFPQTQHNMSPLFTQYWQQHGGLAQFGYAKTEAFRELNPADNHIYVVQYFERARFEYHPELTGTPYEVELGLLGNQLIAPRIAAGEGAFNSFPDMHYPGGSYFPQTGHNLRNDFLKYWQAHGGLAIYGYPKSEEFYEVNPDDGQTYVVQYFERNRFEYHPENTGTPYVVLLGLLGNQVLRDRGWLS